jgi:hypothetical protein
MAYSYNGQLNNSRESALHSNRRRTPNHSKSNERSESVNGGKKPKRSPSFMIQPASAVVAAIGSIAVNIKDLDNSVLEGTLSPHSMKSKGLIGRHTTPKRSVFSHELPKNP